MASLVSLTPEEPLNSHFSNVPKLSRTLFIAPKAAQGGPRDDRQGFVDSLCLVALILISSHTAAAYREIQQFSVPQLGYLGNLVE